MSDDPYQTNSNTPPDDPQANSGTSGVRNAVNSDSASEEETLHSSDVHITDPDDDPDDDEDFATPLAKNIQSSDHGSGEDDAAGGTAPDPASDDDVGEMMKRVTGEDPDPNMDNPQELGLGNEIDRDEEAIRES